MQWQTSWLLVHVRAAQTHLYSFALLFIVKVELLLLFFFCF